MLLERESELGVLRTCLEGAAAGHGSVVIVEGPAGVGKTSLLDATWIEAEASGLFALRAGAHELERQTPGAVARQLIGPPLRAESDRERVELLSGLEAILEPLLDGLPGPGGEDPAATMTIALATLFGRMVGRAEPCRSVLFVDDAHWADPVSLRLLSHLRRDRPELAIVVSLRADEPQDMLVHDLRGAAGTVVVRPAPLSDRAVTVLVRSQLPEAAPAFCDVCASASAGNPLLLREMLRALSDEGVAGTAAEAARLEGFVPDSVMSAVLVRLARLPEPAAALARALSILGQAPLWHVARLAGLAQLDADAAADELVAAGLVVSGEPLAFAHPLVQTAIYKDQTPFARARAHRRAASILDADGARVEAVAAHLQRGRSEGDGWVVETLRGAARSALESGDPAAAVGLLERALQEPPARDERAAILIELADASAANAAPDAVERLQEALVLIADPLRRAEALYGLGSLLLARFDLFGAAACAEQGLEQIDATEPLGEALEGILLASAGLVPELRDRVVARLAELRAAALDGRDPRDSVTLAVLALRMTSQGDDRRTIRRLVIASIETSRGRPAARAATIGHLGSALVYSEDLDWAERELTTMIEEAGRAGRVLTAGFARVWRAHARLRCGRLAEARADAEEALELRHFGWEVLVGPCLGALIEVLIEQDEMAAAADAVALAERLVRVERQALVLSARARFAVASGRPEDAAADIKVANGFLSANHTLDNPTILPWRSQLGQALGRLDEAERAAELALDEARLAASQGSPRPQGIALVTAGAIVRGDRGVELLRKAVDVLDGTTAELEQARARVELGATLRRAPAGRRSRAVATGDAAGRSTGCVRARAARTRRARRHRRPHPAGATRWCREPHADRAPDRPAGGRRAEQSGNRRHARRHPQDGGMAPQPDLQQARRVRAP